MVSSSSVLISSPLSLTLTVCFNTTGTLTYLIPWHCWHSGCGGHGLGSGQVTLGHGLTSGHVCLGGGGHALHNPADTLTLGHTHGGHFWVGGKLDFNTYLL